VLISVFSLAKVGVLSSVKGPAGRETFGGVMNTAPRPSTISKVPSATYRLQFNREFTLESATAILTYLRELGISDIYASPLFQAGPESTHGYDVCCFTAINASVGTEEQFGDFTRARKANGLGMVLDMVPNHMGAALSNGWWLDVLENGHESRYAAFFDIDWNPPNRSLRNKVLLPVLGDHYGKVLERGELQLKGNNGRISLAYFEHEFPIRKSTIPPKLAAAIQAGDVAAVNALLRELNGQPDRPKSFDDLHHILDQQAYRLAFWRVGSEEINYRRFFDVTQLVGLRMEELEVFAATHEVVFRWLREGAITGLRIDHPDGLRDPREYFRRLQTGNAECHGSEGGPLYVVAEKILSGDERLPKDWPVAGTTGYDFLNRLNGVFVDASNEARMTELYENFCSGQDSAVLTDFPALVRRSKKQILELSLTSEWESLARRLHAVASVSRGGRDLTLKQCRSVLNEMIAAFPVYRTYLTKGDSAPGPQDLAVIRAAFDEARQQRSGPSADVLGFLEGLLTLELLPSTDSAAQESAWEFILRFQQLTGPVMAKGLEDTAFYNFNRLISLNEVGGEPGRFGCSVDAFHEANRHAAEHWPHTLLATSTHDTKRGEDARARINILSELTDEWAEIALRWRKLNWRWKQRVGDQPAPSANDEYLLLQSLVGAFPEEECELDSFRDRTKAFALKALREAKTNTNWLEPNIDYETAVEAFINAILSKSADNVFLLELREFAARVAFFGRVNSLSQTVLKLASPGVPDIYQGTELWDFSFVDPDNRRAVDFDLRQRLLGDLRQSFRDGATIPEVDASARAKLFVTWRALDLRQRARELFAQGSYVPLKGVGPLEGHVCAFARRHGRRSLIAVVPRLVAKLTAGREVPPLGDLWQDTFLTLPGDLNLRYRNVFTGEVLNAEKALAISAVLRRFPVALLESADV